MAIPISGKMFLYLDEAQDAVARCEFEPFNQTYTAVVTVWKKC